MDDIEKLKADLTAVRERNKKVEAEKAWEVSVARRAAITLMTYLVAGLALTIIMLVVKPILKVITFPITIITFGIFSIILNILLFWFVSPLVSGFDIATFWDAVWGAVIVGVVQWLVGRIVD